MTLSRAKIVTVAPREASEEAPEEIEGLARQIAARMAPDALLDAEDVAAILKCSTKYVTSQYAIAPGFSKALRLTGPGGRRSKPKWRRCDIMAWIDSHSPGETLG